MDETRHWGFAKLSLETYESSSHLSICTLTVQYKIEKD